MVFREPRVPDVAPFDESDNPQNPDGTNGAARYGFPSRPVRPSDPSERGRVAALAARLFAAVIDHAPHAHAFEYSEETVLAATASARRYAVAQARALLQEVDAQLKEEAKR